MNENNEWSYSAETRSLPPLTMLRAFEAVARHASITRAAHELHVTQSAVSHQIKALEQWLDVKLVQRSGRNIALTSAGLAYAPSLSTAFESIAQATQRLERRTRRQRITVGAFSTVAAHWLAARIAQFGRTHEHVDIDLATSQATGEEDPALFDLSIRCYTPEELDERLHRREWRGVQAGFLLSESLTLVCSPLLLRGKTKLEKPEDVARFTMLESRSIPMAWHDWLRAANVPRRAWPKSRLTFDHMHLALNVAIRGDGVAIGPGAVLSDAIAAGSLALPFPSITVGAKNNYWLRAPRSQGNTTIDALCKWLEQCGVETERRHKRSSNKRR